MKMQDDKDIENRQRHLLPAGYWRLQSVAVVAVLFLISGVALGQSFRDVSDGAGITRVEATFGNPIWGDFDNDGNLDVLDSNHGRAPAVFHNNGDGTFTDLQTSSGIGASGDQHGVAAGDYDNDGDLDLFSTFGGGGSGGIKKTLDQLYVNDGNGVFTEDAAFAGVTNDVGRGRSSNWVDVNNDGLLDLFVKNLKTDNLLYLNNGDGTFVDDALGAGLVDAPGSISSWADYDSDGDMDLFITGDDDTLWQNNGAGTFTEVTSQAGIVNASSGKGIGWGDYNNDGHLDLYIARGYDDGRGALLKKNRTIAFAHRATADEEVGLDFATSAGQDVTLELFKGSCPNPTTVFIGNASASPANLPVTLTESEASGIPAYVPGVDEGFFIGHDASGWHIRWSSTRVSNFYGRMTVNAGRFTSAVPFNDFTLGDPDVTNVLYRNNGDGTFTDVTVQTGVGSTANDRGVAWGDYDNDGDLDLYVVNSGNFRKNEANVLYINNADGTFTADSAIASVVTDGRGEGVAWGDFNSDGFLDLYVTNGWGVPIAARQGGEECLVSGPHVLLKNTRNQNRWLTVSLVGMASNRDGFGARVTVDVGGAMQVREVNGGGGQYFSQGAAGPLHFGVGAARTVDVLTVQWPSGTIQTLTDIVAKQHIVIEEPS